MRARRAQVKPHVLTCFGDIALGPQFAKYLEQVPPMLAQASETEVPDHDDGLIEYLNELCETVLALDDFGRFKLMMLRLRRDLEGTGLPPDTLDQFVSGGG